MSGLLVGAGKASLNPTPDIFPLPMPKVSDWGVKGVATDGIYDDMDARAIAIDNGKNKLLFITYELSALPKVENLREKIAEAISWDKDNLILTATHNHTGVQDHTARGKYEDNDEFREFLRKYKALELNAGIEAAKMAIKTMRPAKYGYGETLSYVNTNRDLETMHGYWVEGRNLAGYSDKTLAIIKFVDLEDNVIAAFLNYPCHGTCAYLMQDFDGHRKTSGNFNGVASKFVEKHYGNDCICMWTSGAAGNQNPLLSHGMQFEYPDGYTTSVDYPDGVGYMHMELLGRTHGADAVKGLDAITKYSEHMPIHHIVSPLLVPTRKRAQSFITPFRMGGRGLRPEDAPYGQIAEIPEIPEMVPDEDNPANVNMQLITLGDIAMICLNAEPYAEIGRDIKLASPYRKTFVITHTEGDKVGYILDKSAAERGEKVFQAYNGGIAPGSADELLKEHALSMFDTLLSEM